MTFATREELDHAESNLQANVLALAADVRESRAALIRVEDAVAGLTHRLRELEATVFDAQRRAVNALAALEKELADVVRVTAADAGALLLRVQALEALPNQGLRIDAALDRFGALLGRVESLESFLSLGHRVSQPSERRRTPPPTSGGGEPRPAGP